MFRRSSLTWPIILASTILALIVVLLVLWIVGQAAAHSWPLLLIGTVFFLLLLIGMVLYLILTIKEIRLNRRQANFIDSVTHELKSPIASIKLCLQTLDMRDVDLDQQREFHRFMLEDVGRLDGLIDHLLTVARLDHAEKPVAVERVQLEPLLRKCAELIERRYKFESGRIELDLQACEVTGNAHDLEMVFMNLIDNAMKYGAATPQVRVQLFAAGKDRVMVRVSDNGAGVHYELRRKIFDRFFRGGSELERTTQGTGLGLYLVKSVVGKMRGSVHVQGRGPLGGATFEVELPGVACSEPPPVATAESAGALTVRNPS